MARHSAPPTTQPPAFGKTKRRSALLLSICQSHQLYPPVRHAIPQFNKILRHRLMLVSCSIL
jgi:hypothetical protein